MITNQTALLEESIRVARQEIMTNKRPRFLYKYRSIDSAIKFLENSSIYFSNYKEFNDPFESACKKKLDFTPKEYFNAFQRVSNNFFASATKAEEIRLGYIDGKDLGLHRNDVIPASCRASRRSSK